ncbi:MAG: site-specific DNA-methyltransferase [Pseudomonadales bacterium]|nr:site-specific DNA-methyltransferase [Pseudomonadales bacterium]
MILEHNANDIKSIAPNADLVFLDPPYNLGVDYGKDESDAMSKYGYLFALREWILSASECVRPGGVVALLISESWADDAGRAMTEFIGTRINRIIWQERFAQYTDRKFTNEHRHLFIHQRFGLDKNTWNTENIRVPSQRMIAGDKRAAGPRVPGDVWTVRRLQGTSNDRVKWHPCQLPPEPLETLVHAYTNVGDLVAEQFSGSGSLARVALRLGRRYIGCDTNPEYVESANARLASEGLLEAGATL